MTNEKAKKMLKAKLECLKRETSGTDIDCNYRNCDECNLCYEQGNMGEQKEALEIAIKALEQQPFEDCVSREQALEAIDTWDKFGYTYTGCFVREPKGDYVPYVHYDDMVKCIKNLPPVKPQRPKGKWLDKKMTIKGAHGMAYGRYACSVCKKKFPNKSNYCPNCGAEMEGDNE